MYTHHSHVFSLLFLVDVSVQYFLEMLQRSLGSDFLFFLVSLNTPFCVYHSPPSWFVFIGRVMSRHVTQCLLYRFSLHWVVICCFVPVYSAA